MKIATGHHQLYRVPVYRRAVADSDHLLASDRESVQDIFNAKRANNGHEIHPSMKRFFQAFSQTYRLPMTTTTNESTYKYHTIKHQD